MMEGRGSTSRRRRGPGLVRVLVVAIGLIGLLALPSAAFAIDEFPVGIKPGGITTGPDGALWFTEEGPPPPAVPVNFIGRLTTSGQYTHFQLPNQGSIPDQIVAGPDGRLWFTEVGGNRIGAITTAGQITEYPNAGGQPQGIAVGPDGALWYTAAASNSIRQIGTDGTYGAVYTIPTATSDPSDLELGPDGRLWFTETVGNKIGALNVGTGAITEYNVGLTPGAEPSGIVATAGGILWFTEPGIAAIGRITTDGTITEFPGAGSSASAIAAAPDGALWYTLGYQAPSAISPPCTGTGEHAIGRITSGGTFTNKFATPTPLSDPSDIALGPDGALWFSEYCADRIGRIVTGGPPPPPPPPVVVLSVSSVKLSPRSFRAAPKGASTTAKKKKKGKTGTKVSYTVSLAASTKFTVERVEKGRKSGKKCVKAKGKKKGRKCTRYVRVKGSFTHKGKAGGNKFGFSGRVAQQAAQAGQLPPERRGDLRADEVQGQARDLQDRALSGTEREDDRLVT